MDDKKFLTFPEAFYWTLTECQGMNKGLAKARLGAVLNSGIGSWRELDELDMDIFQWKWVRGIGEKTYKILRDMQFAMRAAYNCDAYTDLIFQCCIETNTPIVRVFNILHRNGITTFQTLKETGEEELSQIRSVGSKILNVLLYIRESDDRYEKLVEEKKQDVYDREEYYAEAH